MSILQNAIADAVETFQRLRDLEKPLQDGAEIVLWALYPSRRLLSARVSAFLDFLKEAFPSGTPEELAAFID